MFLAFLMALLTSSATSAHAAEVDYESLPSSPNVLYIDFRGGTVNVPGVAVDPDFNDGLPWTYPAVNLEEPNIRRVAEYVAEFYRPFNVNVTTKSSVYGPALHTQKVRIRVTPKERVSKLENGVRTWFDRIVFEPHGIGGAFGGVGGFSRAKNDPLAEQRESGWAFFSPPAKYTVANQIEYLGRTIAHEFGHALGLEHWGTTKFDVGGVVKPSADYYPVRDGGTTYAHGPLNPAVRMNLWAPLMGQYNDAPIVQWSQGEFELSANRTGNAEVGYRFITPKQNDLAFLVAKLGNAPNLDPHGNSRATAAPMGMTGAIPHDTGYIHNSADQDWFSFSLPASTSWQMNVTPRFRAGLNVSIEVQNASGSPVASSSPSSPYDKFDAQVTLSSLPAGQYFLRVKGEAQGSPLNDGWSTYGSLGSYEITCKASSEISGSGAYLETTSISPAAVGVPYNLQMESRNHPTSGSVLPGSPLPPGLALQVNSATGEVSLTGTPTQAGSYTTFIMVENAHGGASRSFVIDVFAEVPISRAVDSPGLNWTTYTSPTSSNPVYLWKGQTVVTSDGISAARSGNRGDVGESWLETFVTGPGLLKFYWATDSEVGDRLFFYVDGTEVDNRTGRINDQGAWQEKTHPIASGGHYLRWNYRKDSSGAEGQDAGFLDRVRFIPVPAFTAYRHLVTTVGFPCLHSLHPWQRDTTYAVSSGTLPGLSLEPLSGAITGFPTTPGSTLVGFSATNEGGTNTTTKTIHVFPNVTLASALDATGVAWQSSGDNGWAGIQSPASDGVDAARSGPLDANGTSWLTGEVTGEGSVSFYWKTSSDVGDKVKFYIDDVFQHELSGAQDWQQRSYTITGTGAHVLKWEFKTDGSGGTGNDIAYLDRVAWTSGFPPVVTSAGSHSAEQGQLTNYTLAATNSPTLYELVDGLVPGMTLNQTTGLFSGTPTVANAYNLVFRASNGAGSDLHGVAFTVVPSIGEAVDNFTQTFSRSGNGNWFGQQSQSQLGGDAAQSADIGDNESCSLYTQVTGPLNLSFWWKTDCEATNDYLILEDFDGFTTVERGRISGSTNWTQVNVSLPGGPRIIRWKYVKNGSISTGADAGWVDGIVFGPSVPVITSTSSIFGPVGYPLNYDIVATNSPTSYNQTGTLPPGMFFSPTIHLITGFPSQAGVWTVAVSATNGAGTASQNVTIYVEGSRVGWNRTHNLTGANALALADPDQDGRPNLLEMALARDPNVRDDGLQPVDMDPATQKLRARFRFNRRLADITYYVETSTDAVLWTPIFTGSNFSWVTTPGTTLIDTFVADMTYDLEVLDATNAGVTGRKFMRMRVVETPPQP